MAYATPAEMTLALGADTLQAIADHDGDRVIDEGLLESVLDEASSFADTYLAGEVVPSPAPAALRRAVIDIAGHYLRTARDMSTEDSRLAYLQAVKWLETIAAGKAALVAPPTEPVVETEDEWLEPGDPESEGLSRIWTRESARRVF